MESTIFTSESPASSAPAASRRWSRSRSTTRPKPISRSRSTRSGSCSRRAGRSTGAWLEFFDRHPGEGRGPDGPFVCKMLLWYEQFGDIDLAIRREKQMKEWKRLWKLRVMNPDWNDLFESLL